MVPCSPKVIIMNSFTEFQSLYKQALQEERPDKFAFLADLAVHASFNSTYGRSLPIMQNERLGKIMSFYMMSNSILFHQINDILKRFVPAGIPKHYEEYGLWYLYRPFDEIITDPRRILSMSDLEYGFVLWLSACLVSFLCFLCELLTFGLEKLKSLIMLIAVNKFLRVLRTRLVH
jgi:hypothetical protein